MEILKKIALSVLLMFFTVGCYFGSDDEIAAKTGTHVDGTEWIWSEEKQKYVKP